ncbi:hypothetical protein SCATT_06910 [Streptantibioticus cattleyicolor NRRL 8057 = DSM 46488]|uniref:Uncharacterized protein n=1 Tax=Streptantibioticus cattleyicolor (strain ATCC 35852 / DSM 46488 / JCM 4925 / NBRC 14057 / NRRL 8057) TaxID=1003195 RepID=G8WVW9_STREN|nr:hypothetical protein SCATT_06910 [Streptantibioticus cattleyicolor NRRL 8057 = DSM 46488]
MSTAPRRMCGTARRAAGRPAPGAPGGDTVNLGGCFQK